MHDGQCFYDDDKQGVMYQLGNIMNKIKTHRAKSVGLFVFIGQKQTKSFTNVNAIYVENR